MAVGTANSQCRVWCDRCSGLLAIAARPLAALALAALLVTASASPQTPARTASARSAPPQATVPETPPPRPDRGRAQQAYRAGQRAEQSGDWKTAYTAYSDAVTYAPANREYPLLREHARFQLVQGLADLAERQVLAGDVAGAREQLMHTLEIDPNYVVARERLAELNSDSVRVAPEKGPRLAGPPRLNPRPGRRDFDYRGTTRGVYEEVGRQFGVTMAFDGDLNDRSIRFRAPKVDFETALLVLARQTRTFTRVVDEHTLFVTDDSVQKMREYAPEIEKSLILPASVSTDEMNETVRMIREMTGITRTQLDTASRTLTVRSTEQNVALAQALVEQIEQPHGEMMLEVEILEVDRNAAHQLGITPPTSAQVFTLSSSVIRQLQQAQNSGTLLQVLQSLFGSGGALAGAAGGLASVLPPLIAFGGGNTIFLATMPGATANFSQTLSAVRSAQRILLRAQDGKAATFFVGDRFPISLALLSSSLNPTTTALAGLFAGLLPRTDFTVGTAPIGVAIADFNGDGFPDLVAANQTDSTTNGTISLLLGATGGTFGTQILITIPGGTLPSTPSAVAVGDFNGDGSIDIAVTDSANNTVAILLGRGDGTFAAPVTYPTGNAPVALLAKDFNADGFLDLAVVNQAGNTVSILLGNGDGTFAAATDYPVDVAPAAIASADFNDDGVLDLAVANHGDSSGTGGNTVSVLLGNSDGTFKPKTDYATGNGPAGIATADFNLDGRTDLAVTNQDDNTVSILLGNGDGTFAAHTDYAAGSGPVGIVAANFTGGANPALAVADQTGNNLSLLIGNGDGTFTSPVSLPTGNMPVAVAAADLNGDGTLDVVDANESSNSVTVTLNTLRSANSASSLASAQSAYPAAQYVDLGLKLKATPRLHNDDEVTLQLQFNISSLAGSSINGIPVLSNRTIEQTIRLRENETSVLSGVIQSSNIRSISGWPWTSTAPGVGYLTGENTGNSQQNETFIIITPRALHLPPHNPRAIYAGREEPSSPGGPPALPPGAPPEPSPNQAPALDTQPAPTGPGQPAPAPGPQQPPFGAPPQQRPSL
ncbi:MAG: FG-GAP-like repeat-containing protein [Acidobacteriia bacterium]|nr:FG-GAP-like repeat-containing protein [Terriglobia bacterium]